MGSLFLKLQEDISQTLCSDGNAEALTADLIILAETASERAAGEEYGTAAVNSADARLFPGVKSSSGGYRFRRAVAVAPGSVTVDSAVSGAEVTILICETDGW